MTILPALVTRPLVDAYADASPRSTVPPAAPVSAALDSDLPDGIPARLQLDAYRGLVLAVPLGLARPLLDADPLTVVVDGASISQPPPGLPTGPDLPWPRLTLVTDAGLGSTAVVVPGVPARLGVGDRALVEVVVDQLRLTVGALRGPGRFDSRIRLRWTDLTTAGDTGPAPAPTDPALDLLREAHP